MSSCKFWSIRPKADASYGANIVGLIERDQQT